MAPENDTAALSHFVFFAPHSIQQALLKQVTYLPQMGLSSSSIGSARKIDFKFEHISL